jgi:serine/threonine protein kinase
VKFQCVLCLSTYNVSNVQFGESIECPNCTKKIVVPKKAFDRGRVIGGDFVIERILGTGGMGTVYLARQISLEREVALKVLSRKFSEDPKFRLEFQREARAASRLTHSNLVQAYAFGEDEGDLFLAMEYVEGVTLGDRLDNETRLNCDEALNIIQQVAEGLHFAWTQEQLIHRDIKPDNIMLTPDGHVKLTDMGLARTAVELENVTEVSGTPAYMNPEQFTKQAMDCRADIYSLGVCLYHSVTGQLPFESPNVRELARQHIQDKLEFPDKTVDLPNELKKLIRKTMQKNRNDRHHDHDDLLHDIYATRLKLSNHGQHIPSVHTLSFNRYEFKNLTPERKGAANDTQVSSTKQLQRRKIKPLSAATSHITTSFSTEGGSRGFSIIMSNIIAMAAIIAAIVMAFMLGGDSESQFYEDVHTFIESIDQSKMSLEEIIDKTDDLLSQENTSNINKKDYYARNRLLEIKLRYAKQLQEKKDQELKKRDKNIEDLNQEVRRLSLLKNKSDELIQQKLKELESELDLARKRQKENKTTIREEIKQNEKTFSFATAISADILVLQKLWSVEKNKHILEILKSLATRKYTTAIKYIEDSSKDYKGSYLKWFDQQRAFVSDAQTIWNTVELNLQELKGHTVQIDGKLITIERAYPQTAELETAAGTLVKLTDQSIGTFLNVYKEICSSLSIKENNGASYAVSGLDFNLAITLSPNDQKVLEYATVYIEDRLIYIAKLLETGEKDKAEELGKKFYKQCALIDTDLKSKLTKLFGKDIIPLTDLIINTP